MLGGELSPPPVERLTPSLRGRCVAWTWKAFAEFEYATLTVSCESRPSGSAGRSTQLRSESPFGHLPSHICSLSSFAHSKIRSQVNSSVFFMAAVPMVRAIALWSFWSETHSSLKRASSKSSFSKDTDSSASPHSMERDCRLLGSCAAAGASATTTAIVSASASMGCTSSAVVTTLASARAVAAAAAAAAALPPLGALATGRTGRQASVSSAHQRCASSCVSPSSAESTEGIASRMSLSSSSTGGRLSASLACRACRAFTSASLDVIS
mmetsp:Transcript_34704/g.81869  ORF Transcript_34704/g.81869 Transcript_34704/m.81869 type:complete len:268 (-) Transcript_34704:268-1071(-)